MIRKVDEKELVNIFWLLDSELAMKTTLALLLGETYQRINKVNSPGSGTIWACVSVVNGKWIRVMDMLSDPKQQDTYLSITFDDKKEAYLSMLCQLAPKLFETWSEYTQYIAERKALGEM